MTTYAVHRDVESASLAFPLVAWADLVAVAEWATEILDRYGTHGTVHVSLFPVTGGRVRCEFEADVL